MSILYFSIKCTMKRSILKIALGLLLGLFLYELSASATLNGRVIAENGKPVVGAIVEIHPGGEKLGTNEDGYFSIDVGERKIKQISVTRIGIAPVSVDTDKIKSTEGAYIIEVKTVPITLQGSVATDNRRPGELRRSSTPSVRDIDGRKITMMTGANEDLLRSLSYMPGVVTRSDFTSQLYVRGGGPDQNLVLVDGIMLANPYRLGTYISCFNPYLVSDVELLPGGFPVNYGDRLSSVLYIKYRNGRRDRYSLSTNASLITTSLLAEGPLFDKKGGFIASVRRTHYDLALNAFSTEKVAYPYFYDLQSKLDYDFSDEVYGEIHLNASTGGFKLKTEQGYDDRDIVDLHQNDQNRDGLLSFTLGYKPSDNLNIRSQIAHIYRWDKYRAHGTFDVDVNIDAWRVSVKQDAVYKPDSKDYRVSMGWEHHHGYYDFGWDWVADDTLRKQLRPGDEKPFMPSQYQFDYNGRNLFGGAYLSFDYLKWNKFKPTIGIRMDSSEMVGETNFSPRLSLNYRLDPQHTFKFAWGYYYQHPNYEQLAERGYYPELWRNSDIKAEKAIHYLAGWEYLHDINLVFGLDFYYKHLDDLVVDNPDGIPVNAGRGYSEGIEIYIEKRKLEESKISGWISYTLGKAWKKTPWDAYYPINDQRHTINILADIRLGGGVDLGLNWHFGSGMPYTPIVGADIIYRKDAVTGLRIPYATPIYGATNSSRYPAYHRLDVRLGYNFEWFSLPWTIYAEALNAYNRKNVHYYSYHDIYSEREAIYEMPLMPSFGLSVTFF
ncbi:MAG: TonB-dependent receptor plug domain-containing protein [candidate division Zixibacteria bacterium]|nr:TonB-dependent receptor plug domain-containing protein [candidate division Zixibacteria bacterium]